MPNLHIKGFDKPDNTFEWNDSEQVITIGRDPSATIQIKDTNISRLHARIIKVDRAWIIQDTQSKNGTFVNDRQIKERALEQGDQIEMVGYTLTFHPQVEEVDDLLLEAASSAGLPEDSEKPLEVFEEIEATSIKTTEPPKEEDQKGSTMMDAPVQEICDLADVTLYNDLQADASMVVLQNANRKLVFLLELIREGLGFSSLDALAEFLQQRLASVLEASRAYFFCWNAERLSLYTPAEPVLEGIAANTPISNSLIDHARKEGTGILVRNPHEDERFQNQPSMVANQVVSSVCAPVQMDSQTLGFLYLDRLGDGQGFSREDLEFLVAIANQTGVLLQQIEAREKAVREVERLTNELKGQFDFVGQSPLMQKVFWFIEQAAAAEAGVLVLGESGTGKELVARAIHYNSIRKSRRFVAVNCAAMTPALLESELFGHVRGAFTGADKDRKGLFEEADGGTLFLDEIGELPMESQSKLLRVLETGEIRRLGESRDRKVDTRIIAATNRDLKKHIDSGAFRKDLYYRLNILSVQLPPLRDRQEDIPLLIEHFLHHFAARCAKKITNMDPKAQRFLENYAWPGNVRELMNILERMVVMCTGGTLTFEDIPLDLRTEQSADKPLETSHAALAEIEKQHILGVFESVNGNKKQAAEILGIDRSTLYKKLEQYTVSQTANNSES